MSGPHERWASERLFWSVLEAPGWNKTGPLPSGLWSAFEEDCPVPVSELHAVCAPVGDGRVLVCAARRDELAELAGSTLSVSPQRVPEFAGDHVAAASLNLLVGKCEPAAFARTRLRSHMCAAATMAAVCVLAALGMSRRAMHERETAAMARRLLGEVLASRGWGDAESLTMEVTRLRRVVRGNAQVERPADAAAALEAVLHAWPTSCAARTQSISVGPAGATIVASVEGEASEFIGSFRPATGWVMDEPRLNRVDGTTRLTLHLRRGEGVAQ